MGVVEKRVLDHLENCISARCGLPCRVSGGMGDPEYAFDEKRGQYNSKLILKPLLEACPDHALRIIGVTQVDMFVPILKYVYGLALMEGRCAVISLHRLRPEFYDHLPDPVLLMDRAEKTAIHEVGHSFGLTHCRDRHCVMYPSTRIRDTDFKEPDFCPTCFELFKWNLKNLSPSCHL
ncbi:MAG: archaemetzincin [Thermodesulfobacteriota bacterium]|nr:archaemetzincin [Thermodesulfobacteriota bacterium]